MDDSCVTEANLLLPSAGQEDLLWGRGQATNNGRRELLELRTAFGHTGTFKRERGGALCTSRPGWSCGGSGTWTSREWTSSGLRRRPGLGLETKLRGGAYVRGCGPHGCRARSVGRRSRHATDDGGVCAQAAHGSSRD
ncbi:hypothetical protein NDU88_006179 [Pleurodeles waltl]|uniref:Uncharacterized protein n=1 Tax=Pleurodeles waltl TaxID=8319 RepID=A0AAV7PHW2_PLEWA|nr:hypothetical protein NDU88_006179 [Pleurodeles waltl]